MNIDRFSQVAGIVLGFVSLAFALGAVSTEVLVKATFLMVLVNSLIILSSTKRRPPED